MKGSSVFQPLAELTSIQMSGSQRSARILNNAGVTTTPAQLVTEAQNAEIRFASALLLEIDGILNIQSVIDSQHLACNDILRRIEIYPQHLVQSKKQRYH